MTWIWLILIATWMVTLDAWRRDRTQWAMADRDRGYWLSALTISSIMLLPAIVFVPAYLLGVLPAFASNNGSSGRSRSAVDELRRH